MRQTLRSLAKSPGYCAVVVLTLAIGVGGVATMFTLVNAVLLKPLPYPEPDRLTLIYEVVPQLKERYPVVPVNAGHLQRWRDDARSFESLGLFDWSEETLTAPGEPRRIGVLKLDDGFLPTLGVRPRIGRNFTSEESSPGQGEVVIVTDRFWRRELEADPDPLSRRVTLNGRTRRIVGVLPPDFQLFDSRRIGPFAAEVGEVDVFRPQEILPRHLELGEFNFSAIGRLREGVSLEQATTELNVLQAAITADTPELAAQDMELEVVVRPLAATLAGDSAHGLRFGLGAVLAVLLIGCVNVAIVSLGRAERRKAEMATRAALGAGRWMLVRQTATETLLLSAAGGALGVWLAYSAVAWIRSGLFLDLPRLAEVAIDERVLAFSFVVAALSALLCGALPAWRAASAHPVQAMAGGGRNRSGAPAATRVSEALAASEVALCTVLLVVAGLLVQSLTAVLSRDRGFDSSSSATAELSMSPERYGNFDPRIQALRSMLVRIQEVPGVDAAGLVTDLPLTQENNVRPILPAEAAAVPMIDRPMANFRWASTDYFDAMGIPLLEGRAFHEGEAVERPAVISRSVAERLWPGESALGRRLRNNDDDPELTVVGVAADVPVESLEGVAGMVVYEPYWRRSGSQLSLAVRTRRNLDELSPAVLQAARSIDPEMPAFTLVPTDKLVADASADRRFQALATGSFAGVALALACIGVYGVLAQATGRRTREIGLRMAVGAQSGQVMSAVLRQGLKPVLWGLATGAGLAALAGRALEATLFEVSPLDPATLIAAPLILLTAALLACAIPARRAARVDPCSALRSE
ncbi:MAG: ABC transporter permease [Bryobacterales bacterium]|nr:ABC transporter permease [Bryobacterales bacterium]